MLMNYKVDQIKEAKLSEVNKDEFLDSFDYIISDIEGIVWKEGVEKPMSAEIIYGFNRMNKLYRFVINDGYTSEEEVTEKFKEIGISFIKQRDILTPAKLTFHYLSDFKKHRSVYSICNPLINNYLKENFIDVVTSVPQHINPEDLEDALITEREVGAVLMGVNFNITFSGLAIAHEHLKAHADTDIICTSSNLLYRVNSELQTIGTVSFISLLLEGLRREPIILSRPGNYVGIDIIKYFNIKDPSRVLFVGNSLIKDIQFAIRFGFKTLFLKDNNMEPFEMKAMPHCYRPDYVADSFADLRPFVADYIPVQEVTKIPAEAVNTHNN